MQFQFSRSPDLSQEDRYYTAKVAKAAGINPDQVNQEELRYLFDHSDEEYNPKANALVLKYAPQASYDPSRFQSLMQDLELALNMPRRFYSYGTFFPSYQRALLDYLRDTNTSDHHATLIGAMTSETIREFVQTVRSIYPKAALTVSDIGEQTGSRNAGGLATYVRCNALDLTTRPVIPPGSADSVHLNILLNHLKGDAGRNSDKQRDDMLAGIYQTLHPGGIAVLVDFRNSMISSPEALRRSARLVGFTETESREAVAFKTRRGMDKFFRANSRMPSPTEIEVVPTQHVFTARKPLSRISN